MSEGHTYLNSDNNHNFYNDNDNSNDDDDNNNDIYNNDKYHYPFELVKIIRKSAFVCLLVKEFRISSILLWLPPQNENENVGSPRFHPLINFFN